MLNKKILIIGEVFVDNHLDLKEDGSYIVRLGGIFHAIRACAALNLEYAFAYYAPDYLEKDIKKYSKILNSLGAYRLGLVDKAPNVFLIGGSDESGKQLYNNILCNQAEYIHEYDISKLLEEFNPTDILIFPGRYGTKQILNNLIEFEGRIHIDFNYDSEDILYFSNTNITTAILSTSSTTFSNYFGDYNYDTIVDFFGDKNIKKLLIKENKGGSCLYDYASKKWYQAPAYLDRIMHSVGVGDVYDVTYIYNKFPVDIEKTMKFSAWSSVLYAKTMCFDTFKEQLDLLLQNADEQTELMGIRVPWIFRKKINIYMAAPDFSYVDTSKLDELVEALIYHNYNPRLPIRENGQITKNMSCHEERVIFSKDIELLEECDFMIASLLFNDQGTLVEIGTYQARGKAVILYDPYKLLNNMFLKYSCNIYCRNLNEVIDAVFEITGRMVN